MHIAYRLLFPALWLSWASYWWLAARQAKATERREPMGSRLAHVLPLLLAAYLLWADHVPVALLEQPLYPWAPWQFWVAALVTAAGMGFAVWARLHLGRNWSGTVTIKQGHELIQTGPYALARHPIYTGLLLAFVGTAFARGEWRGVLAVVIGWAALWRKLGVEERWMAEQFGERYEDYKRRVPALLPFGAHGALALDLTDLGTRYAAAWSSGDPAKLAAFYAENGALIVNGGPPSAGRAAVAAKARSFMTAFPDMVVKLQRMDRNGAHPVFRWLWTGTNTGPGGTGKSVRLTGYEEWTLDANGLILESDGHYDEAEYQRQLKAGAP